MLCFHQLLPRGERYHLKETKDLGTGQLHPVNAGARLCEHIELEGLGNPPHPESSEPRPGCEEQRSKAN